jgi:hypothetical protein
MASFFIGLLGGIVAWVGTALLGQPLYTLQNLRAEAARLIALYDNADAFQRNAADAKWLQRRTEAYEEHGSRLVAFGATHRLLLPIIHIFKIQPISAGYDLISLAYLSPGASDRAVMKGRLCSHLHFEEL